MYYLLIFLMICFSSLNWRIHVFILYCEGKNLSHDLCIFFPKFCQLTTFRNPLKRRLGIPCLFSSCFYCTYNWITKMYLRVHLRLQQMYSFVCTLESFFQNINHSSSLVINKKPESFSTFPITKRLYSRPKAHSTNVQDLPSAKLKGGSLLQRPYNNKVGIPFHSFCFSGPESLHELKEFKLIFEQLQAMEMS